MLNAKIALIILLGLFVGYGAFAESQPPPPGPLKTSDIPQSNTEKHHQASEYRQYLPEEKLTGSNISIYTDKIQVISNHNQGKANDKSSTDWWLVVFTGVLAGVSFFQYRVTKRQSEDLHKSIELTREEINLTREELEITKSAANSAQKSADALPLIERAYVFVSIPYHVIIPVKEDPGLLECKVTVALFNHGKTPAILKQLKVNMRVIPINEELGDDLIGDTESEIPEGVIIGSGTEYKNDYSIILRKNQWEDIENIYSTLFCYGRIIYEDVLKDRRTTGYCWDYHPVILKCFYISNNKKLNYYT